MYRGGKMALGLGPWLAVESQILLKKESSNIKITFPAKHKSHCLRRKQTQTQFCKYQVHIVTDIYVLQMMKYSNFHVFKTKKKPNKQMYEAVKQLCT